MRKKKLKLQCAGMRCNALKPPYSALRGLVAISYLLDLLLTAKLHLCRGNTNDWYDCHTPRAISSPLGVIPCPIVARATTSHLSVARSLRGGLGGANWRPCTWFGLKYRWIGHFVGVCGFFADGNHISDLVGERLVRAFGSDRGSNSPLEGPIDVYWRWDRPLRNSVGVIECCEATGRGLYLPGLVAEQLSISIDHETSLAEALCRGPIRLLSGWFCQ